MNRRNFITRTVVAGGATALATTSLMNATASETQPSNGSKFKLRYAPGFGTFQQLAGNDLVDQIKFCADQGFRAMFDNGLPGKTAKEQELMANEMAKRDMLMGPYVLYADFSKESMVLRTADVREMLIKKVKEGIEVSKRTGVKWALMVPGRYNEQMDWGLQTANVIDNLREMSDIAAKEGMIIVLEPLNKRDHPGLFLTGMAQTYAICRAVNSPSCKIVEDMYHQQITEGNIIPNIDNFWSEIAAFHIGDNPGRREPGSGEINYNNIFKHINAKGYDGVLCMEHGRSKEGKEGDLALIEAYRKADNF